MRDLWPRVCFFREIAFMRNAHYLIHQAKCGCDLGRSEQKIIDKVRSPTRALKLATLIMRDLHLRKEKTCAAEFLLVVAQGRPTAVQSPIPECEHHHIR